MKDRGQWQKGGGQRSAIRKGKSWIKLKRRNRMQTWTSNFQHQVMNKKTWWHSDDGWRRSKYWHIKKWKHPMRQSRPGIPFGILRWNPCCSISEKSLNWNEWCTSKYQSFLIFWSTLIVNCDSTHHIWIGHGRPAWQPGEVHRKYFTKKIILSIE